MQTINAFVVFFAFLHIYVQGAIVDYSFVIEEVPANPDGHTRSVIAVYDKDIGWNPQRVIPGPTIRAILGDTLQVTFENRLESATSIHWHGIRQEQNAWMDGVIGITECGIQSGQSFTYIFNITQTGTFWWHSHHGNQRTDGMLGPLILEYPPNQDPVMAEYPYSAEYVLMLQDWFHQRGADIILAYKGPHNSFPGYKPQYPWPTTSFLLNGIGTFNCSNEEKLYVWPDPDAGVCESSGQNIPLPISYFAPCDEEAHLLDSFICNSSRIRLRLVNAGDDVAQRFWIDQHNLTIVARDGVEITPVEVPFVTIPLAQRLDVIVKCNGASDARYAMFTTLAAGFIPSPTLPNVHAKAYLDYPGTFTNKTEEPPSVSPLVVAVTDPIFGDNVLFEYGLAPRVPTTFPGADSRVLIINQRIFDYNNGSLEYWALNKTVFAFPTTNILQTLYTSNTVPNNTQPLEFIPNYSVGTNTITLEYGKIIEIVVVNSDSQPHAFHLHGYTPSFIEVGSIDFTAVQEEQDYCGRNVIDPYKVDYHAILPPYDQPRQVLTIGDSFTVPKRGYTIFRFKATNPGPWLLHCHVEWHIHQGMVVLFSVENKNSPNVYSAIMPPRPDMPVCGSLATWKSVQRTSSDTGSEADSYRIATIVLGVMVGLLVISNAVLCFGRFGKEERFVKLDELELHTHANDHSE